jgi:asparagine synthase (glutamine-hydrolysing)
MPGLAGIITSKPAEKARRELARMMEAMRHEPFYRSGTWTDDSLGVYVGWMERGDPGRVAMPQQSEDGQRILMFSGEEFPAPGAVQALRDHGHRFGSERNAHLIHQAEEDASFPSNLNGNFHGLIVDRVQQSATLFNDRHASRRVYFHETEDAFYFAAEAKAILAVKPELRALDPRGLGEYMSCGCVLQNRSLFKGIEILPWASAWRFRHARLQSRGTYFRDENWEQEPLAPAEFYMQLQSVFARNLPRYFDHNACVGLSLTGGLDTRMMLAWHKPAPHSVPCYTFGGPYRDSRDVRIARRVAEACGQSHQVIPVGSEFLDRFAHYAERTVFLTDGATGVHQAPDLYVNELARTIAPIRLTGNYGDEVIRRSVVFRPSALNDQVFQPEFVDAAAHAHSTYAEEFDGSLKDAATRQVSWFFCGLAYLESSQVEMRSPYLDNEYIQTLHRAPSGALSAGDVRVRMIRNGDPRLGRIRTDLGYAGRGGPVAMAASRFWNRATMRAEYAFENGDPAWVPALDRAILRGSFEKTFVGIHKFTHFGRWYGESLAGYVREMLLDSRSLGRPYLNSRGVEALVEEHVSGAANHTPSIHKLITLEYIHRLFVDAS